MAYSTSEKKNLVKYNRSVLLIIIPVIVLGVVSITLGVFDKYPRVEYKEDFVNVEKNEYASPAEYLKTHGRYSPTVLGGKYRIEGTILNTASLATFKDVVFKVSFYSKIKAKIGSELVTINDVFPPKGVRTFDFKVVAPEATEEVSWAVVGAAGK